VVILGPYNFNPGTFCVRRAKIGGLCTMAIVEVVPPPIIAGLPLEESRYKISKDQTGR